jgi:hypothetical protein
MLRIRQDPVVPFGQDAIDKFVRRAIAHRHSELPAPVCGKGDRDLSRKDARFRFPRERRTSATCRIVT